MDQHARRKIPQLPKLRLHTELQRELAGTALLFCAIFVGGALVSRGNPEAHCWSAGARFGPVGSCFRAASFTLIGPVASILLPLLPILAAAHVVRRVNAAQLRGLYTFIGSLTVLLAMAVALMVGVAGGIAATHDRAGYIGSLAAIGIAHVAGVVGTWLIVLLALYIAARVSLQQAGVRVRRVMARHRRAALTTPAVAPASRPRQTVETRIIIDAPEPELPAEEPVALPSAELLVPTLGLSDENAADREATEFRLAGALRHMHLDATITGRTRGPAVTRYEVEISPSTPVRDIVVLTNHLATALRLPAIRIAPIPGRLGLGIEIPNASATPVSLRGLIESDEYRDAARHLPLAVGRDLTGASVVTDLAKMPNLLIAGASGSGKSVCLNGLITSLLYRHSARSLRMLVIDTDDAGLAVYDHLPHLWGSVVTDYRKAAAALEDVLDELRGRCDLLAASGARNIQDFNNRLASPAEPMPHIVVVIDDVSDLLRAADNVADPLAELLSRARTAGIHVIGVTRCAAPNVITPTMRALFPARVALRMESAEDSANLIERAGAESLLGAGDLLFLPPGRSEPTRLQAPMVSESDTRRLVHWFAEQSGIVLPEIEAETVTQELVSAPVAVAPTVRSSAA